MTPTATDAAVRAAFYDAFTAGVPSAQWANAAEDGPALIGLRGQINARFPGLARTEAVAVDGMSTLGGGDVEVGMTLTFTDPSVPVPGGLTTQFSAGMPGTAIRTTAGWQLSRVTYSSGRLPDVSALAVAG
ncbi:hypothetical protein [Pseudofrankia inefficax]|uniref:SnoaL-like domain-containing protein n=1 Tax=Pseudofrankia inefficax (strain DSM 45817 / CECT 9037 / DDB 130130 / EuI1c) TaxID=298654 RepID=E3ITZ6_PSEI1|nr:hypothetical protein [Pseudofrankia inefficax]ADP81189.1 hypothetical protein FraEuI1c_3174 [Pseudofrankia inefficax]